MFNSNNGYSLADVAAATRNDDGGFGGNGAWWIIILFIFCFAGWGNGNWGGFGGNSSNGYLTEADLQRGFDNQTVLNKLNGLENGLCDGFYAMNTSLLNGFNGIQNQLNTGALTAQQIASNTDNLINTNFANVNYNMATQFCDTRRSIGDNIRNLNDNQNSNTQAILAAIQQIREDAKDDKIATLTAENQNLRFEASQQTQNNYLVSALTPPAPVPAFQVPNPFASYYTGCGCNQTCC